MRAAAAESDVRELQESAMLHMHARYDNEVCQFDEKLVKYKY